MLEFRYSQQMGNTIKIDLTILVVDVGQLASRYGMGCA